MGSRPNVVILTSGISGSSVLASVIARRGYWLGSRTERTQYETAENSRLVALNKRLFKVAGQPGTDLNVLPPPDADRITRLADEIDLTEYREFVEQCEQQRPWLWKDPRLCYTAGFWHRLIDFNSTKVIVMSRAARQAWIGLVLRGRWCVDYGDSREMHTVHGEAVRRFLDTSKVTFHATTFETLTVQPDVAVAGLNQFLDLDLTVDDVRAVYRGQLFKPRWTLIDDWKARALYFYCSKLRGLRVNPRKR